MIVRNLIVAGLILSCTTAQPCYSMEDNSKHERTTSSKKPPAFDEFSQENFSFTPSYPIKKQTPLYQLYGVIYNPHINLRSFFSMFYRRTPIFLFSWILAYIPSSYAGCGSSKESTSQNDERNETRPLNHYIK
jgi:hypothetical protein